MLERNLLNATYVKRDFPCLPVYEIMLEFILGEKPYQCQFCQRAFTKQSTLQVHKKTHTGQKQFLCQVCDKILSCYSSLAKAC